MIIRRVNENELDQDSLHHVPRSVLRKAPTYIIRPGGPCCQMLPGSGEGCPSARVKARSVISRAPPVRNASAQRRAVVPVVSTSSTRRTGEQMFSAGAKACERFASRAFCPRVACGLSRVFLSLAVIPHIRLTDKGLVDVFKFDFITLDA